MTPTETRPAADVTIDLRDKPALTQRDESSGRGRQELVVGSVVATVAVLVALPCFVALTRPGVRSDILRHAELATLWAQSGKGLSYTIWYPLVWLASGGTGNPIDLRVASVALLTVAVAARVVLTFVLLRRRLAPWAAGAVSLALLVAMPLYDPARPDRIYLGQLGGTVWHNSTNVLAAPFALVAFAAAGLLLSRPSLATAAGFGAAAFACAAAKPNVLLALLPVVGAFLLFRCYRLNVTAGRTALWGAVSLLPAAVLVLAEGRAVYGTAGWRSDAALTWAPLEVWSSFSPSPLRSALLSLAFPLAVLLLRWRTVRTDRTLLLAWTVAATAIAQAALLSERSADPTNPITSSGNFFWGAYTAVMWLFLVSALRLFQRPPHPAEPANRLRRPGLRSAYVLAGGLFALHVATGVLYVSRLLGPNPTYY